MASKRQIRSAMDQRFNRKAEKTKYLSAIIGHPDGTVSVEDNPGYLWARLGGDGGQIIQVYARGILPAYNLPIVVYRLPHRPRDYGIVDLDVDGWGSTGSGEDIVGYTGNGYLTKHGEQHWFVGGDPTLTHLRAWTPLRLYIYNGLIVGTQKGILMRYGVDVEIDTQIFDLTSHVPGSGARYVLMAFDAAGVLQAINGATVSDLTTLVLSDIPVTPDGHFRLAAVRLYAGQTALVENATTTDIIDLRWPQENVAGVTLLATDIIKIQVFGG